jgi:hypothetical protein
VTQWLDVTIPGLRHDEERVLGDLFEQLRQKSSRNTLRAAYYDGKNALQDLGISTPPAFRNVATVLGWPAKAVDVLNRRCRLEGFALPGSDPDAFGIGEVWRANRLDLEAPQAGVSSLIHAVAWLITTRGDVAAGEPEVLVTSRDALTGTGLWDARHRALSAFLSVTDVDESGLVSGFTVYRPGENLIVSRPGGKWVSERRRTGLNRVMVEPLSYQPRLGRPFGASRISRAVMSLTDSALRTVIRSEVSAEFYSAPQRYLLGASESAFVDATGAPKSQWQAIMGRVWAIDSDDDGGVPQVGQFPQMSQTPHMDQLKAWAELFAGETSIPISSLGVSTDGNPTSAESYLASREDLISEAEGTTDGWSPAWVATMRNAVEIREGSVPVELDGLRAKWRNPAYSSRAAAADAAQKLVSIFPWMADSDAALEMLGMDPVTTERLIADKRTAQARATVSALRSAAGAITG